jgi:hypothetical protein
MSSLLLGEVSTGKVSLTEDLEECGGDLGANVTVRTVEEDVVPNPDGVNEGGSPYPKTILFLCGVFSMTVQDSRLFGSVEEIQDTISSLTRIIRNAGWIC